MLREGGLLLEVSDVVLDEREHGLQLRVGVQANNFGVVGLEVHQVLAPAYPKPYHWLSSCPTTPSFSYTKFDSVRCRR